MDTPLFTDGQFVDMSLLNTAASLSTSSLRSVAASIFSPGLFSPSSLVFTYSNSLNVTITAGAAFRLLTKTGILAVPNGTTPGASNSVYTISFTGLVPGSGSTTAYIVASAIQIGQSPATVIGPPNGHPDYNPANSPATVYTDTQDSIAITTTTTAPDNITYYEVARVTLSSGQTSVTSLVLNDQIQATPTQVVSIYSGNPNGNVAGTQGSTGVTPSLVWDTIDNKLWACSTTGIATSAVWTGFGMLDANNTWTASNAFTSNVTVGGAFNVTGTTTVAALAAAAITGTTLACTGAITGASLGTPGALNATGNGAIGGSLNVAGNVTTGPTLTVNGTTGSANVLLEGPGSTTPNKWLRANSGQFQVINSANTQILLSLTDAGNLGVTGTFTAASIASSGGITAGNGISSSTTMYAATTIQAVQGLYGATLTIQGTGSFGGTVTISSAIQSASTIFLQSNGAYSASVNYGNSAYLPFYCAGSSNPNAATIYAQFAISISGQNGIQALPSGLILQWGQITLGNGGNQAVNLNETYPNACLWSNVSYGALPVAGNTCGSDPANVSQIGVGNATGGSNQIYWIAIGH